MIGITFATWMGFNGPPILINILIVWLYLNLRYIGAKEFCIPTKHTPAEKQQVKAHLKEEYEKLGPVTAHEIGVGTIFFCVVLLWIFRDPQIFPGWKSLIHANDTGDSTPAILGCVLLFVLPRDWSFLSGTGRHIFRKVIKIILLIFLLLQNTLEKENMKLFLTGSLCRQMLHVRFPTNSNFM